MKVQLISQNVQGLNGLLSPHKVRNIFQDRFATLDFLCIQEHKLRGPKLAALNSQVWKEAQAYSCEAKEVSLVGTS
jgi:exonuclease III